VVLLEDWFITLNQNVEQMSKKFAKKNVFYYYYTTTIYLYLENISTGNLSSYNEWFVRVLLLSRWGSGNISQMSIFVLDFVDSAERLWAVKYEFLILCVYLLSNLGVGVVGASSLVVSAFPTKRARHYCLFLLKGLDLEVCS